MNEAQKEDLSRHWAILNSRMDDNAVTDAVLTIINEAVTKNTPYGNLSNFCKIAGVDDAHLYLNCKRRTIPSEATLSKIAIAAGIGFKAGARKALLTKLLTPYVNDTIKAEELCLYTGVTRQALLAWYNGRAWPGAEIITKIARYTNMSAKQMANICFGYTQSPPMLKIVVKDVNSIFNKKIMNIKEQNKVNRIKAGEDGKNAEIPATARLCNAFGFADDNTKDNNPVEMPEIRVRKQDIIKNYVNKNGRDLAGLSKLSEKVIYMSAETSEALDNLFFGKNLYQQNLIRLVLDEAIRNTVAEIDKSDALKGQVLKEV